MSSYTGEQEQVKDRFAEEETTGEERPIQERQTSAFEKAVFSLVLG